jgi:ABC-type nitrate/sulfonate/bicarbonate transport system substrate-binding protein
MALVWRLLPIAVLLAVGCGGPAGSAPGTEEATLLLDELPSAVHAGIYAAVERGYDEAEGVRLEVRIPRRVDLAPRMLRRGGADLAVLGLADLAEARERGMDVVGVMALVQRPPGSPPASPARPELVVAAARRALDERRSVVEAAVRGLQRGILEAQADPEAAAQTMAGAVRGTDRAALAAELERVLPAFTAGARFPGELRPAAIEAWARAEAPQLDLAAAFDTGLARPISRD